MYRAFQSLARRLRGAGAETISHDAAGAPGIEEPVRSEAMATTAPPRPKVAAERARPDDAQVREWKGTWVTGAESRWAGKSLLENPHPSSSPRAAAWRAGWHWAERQPDRRQSTLVRFAHQHRRRTDRSSVLVRRAQAGAVGLSVLTVAGWLWQIRRQRTRARRDT